VQAVVYTGPLTIEVKEVEEPTTAADEVVVEMRAVGICGSELEGFATQSPFRVPPLIMGHEVAGIRTDTGEHVAINPVVSCMTCDLCSRGQVNVCRNRTIIGIQRPGGYSERLSVPAVNLVPARPDLAFTTLALAEPLANAVHAFDLVQAHDPWPQRVGVIGAGAIGMCLGLVARIRGVPQVEIVDPSVERCESAKRAGITVAEGELSGEFDVVFDSVGMAATRGASIARLRPGGTAVWVGLHAADADLDGRHMIRNEIRVLTTFCYNRIEFQTAVELLHTFVEPDWIATEPLSAGDEVFRSLLDGPVPATKTMLVN
jgi:threonine dehydrogenase-like Zn-dependent dehydrogenase